MSSLTPLKPSDYPLLKKYFEDQRYRLSIYSLPSIIAWSSDIYQTSYVIINDWLVMASRSSVHPNHDYLIMPLSLGSAVTPEDLHQLGVMLGFSEYWFIPEDYITSIDYEHLEALFDISEQPEFADYIYLSRDLADLSGRRFTKKRNLLHQFNREYLDRNRVIMENITPDNKTACLKFLDVWCNDYHCEGAEKEQLNCEKKAIQVTLDNIELFEVCGLVIRIDSEVSAFSFATALTSDMGVLNYEKAFSHIRGLYQFLDRECVRRCFNDYTYINKECDMGLAGLAQAKKSYYPFAQVKSYRLKMK